MRLGRLSLENNLVLAPLLNVTTGPYRRFIRHFFPVSLVSVPMLYTKRLSKEPKSVRLDLIKIEEEKPISIQVIGNNVEDMKKAALFLESYDFNVLDINAGCPSKRARVSGEGGALLKDLPLLEELINTTIKHSSKPVSLKTRLGFEEQENILSDLAAIINNSDLEFVTIHARYVQNNFNVHSLDLEELKQLVDIIDIPVIGNGDITSGEMALKYLKDCKVEGLMIGRESMGNPEIFNQIHEYLNKERPIPFENNYTLLKERFELYERIIEHYLEGIDLPFSSEEYKLTELKRNSIWMTKKIKEARKLRGELSHAKNVEDLKKIIELL